MLSATMCHFVCVYVCVYRRNWRDDACESVAQHLLLVLLCVVTTLSPSGGLSPLPLDSASSSSTVRRSERKVNVLLGVKSDNERWYVDDLLADANVSLVDENTGVVDRLGKAGLEDLSLQTSLQEVLELESQDVVEPEKV